MTPTDTMMPVTPARLSVRLAALAEERDERVERHAAQDEAEDHHQAEHPVEDEHVDGDQREADDARR